MHGAKRCALQRWHQCCLSFLARLLEELSSDCSFLVILEHNGFPWIRHWPEVVGLSEGTSCRVRAAGPAIALVMTKVCSLGIMLSVSQESYTQLTRHDSADVLHDGVVRSVNSEGRAGTCIAGPLWVTTSGKIREYLQCYSTQQPCMSLQLTGILHPQVEQRIA